MMKMLHLSSFKKNSCRISGNYALLFLKSLPIGLFFFILCWITVLLACSNSRKSTSYKEKDLQMLVKRLNKRGSDLQVIEDIRNVYLQRSSQSLQRIEQYQYGEAPYKWEQMLTETESLQRMYEIIQQNTYALQAIRPVNYLFQIQNLYDSAAASYYLFGLEAFQKEDRSQKRNAYELFQKCLNFRPHFKDAMQKMNAAFDSATVHVLVHKMQFEDFRIMFWMGPVFRSRPIFSVDEMVGKLEGNGQPTIPARFYSETNLVSENRSPDHVVDMIWRNIQFNSGNYQTRSYERSKQIEIGRDTLNQPVYQTVYANLTVLESAVKSSGEFHILIMDAKKQRTVKRLNLPAQFQSSYEYAIYTGDKRALQSSDWTLINRKGTERLPSREQAMEKMMEAVYREAVASIREAVNW